MKYLRGNIGSVGKFWITRNGIIDIAVLVSWTSWNEKVKATMFLQDMNISWKYLRISSSPNSEMRTTRFTRRYFKINIWNGQPIFLLINHIFMNFILASIILIRKVPPHQLITLPTHFHFTLQPAHWKLPCFSIFFTQLHRRRYFEFVNFTLNNKCNHNKANTKITFRIPYSANVQRFVIYSRISDVVNRFWTIYRIWKQSSSATSIRSKYASPTSHPARFNVSEINTISNDSHAPSEPPVIKIIRHVSTT